MISETSIEQLFLRLWPIPRSLSGEPNRQSLKILQELIPLTIHETKSGTEVFDWTVPEEWNVNEAWIKNSKNQTMLDWQACNLHLMGYSEAIHQTMTLKELKPFLHTLKEHPDWIPYLTSYYHNRWGFCLSQNQLEKWPEDVYEVKIDSQFNASGSLSWGEVFIQGESEKEILLSCNICHPSLANNELSGPVLTTFLCLELLKQKPFYSYRLLFIPETIGSLISLKQYGEHWKQNLIAGFTITCVGDSGDHTLKLSRKGDTLADRAALAVMKSSQLPLRLREFDPATGSDERQYCSLGFDLPVVSLMRSKYAEYPEYHTSADNLSFISYSGMVQTIQIYLQIFTLLERNCLPLNLIPFGEPQLGKRGLYPKTGGLKQVSEELAALKWLCAQADGTHDLIWFVEKSGLSPEGIFDACTKLSKAGLITKG